VSSSFPFVALTNHDEQTVVPYPDLIEPYKRVLDHAKWPTINIDKYLVRTKCLGSLSIDDCASRSRFMT
jgi:hypothetical protein